MLNILFNYLYRDAANYKNFGSVVFANPDNVKIEEVATALESRLIDGCWFYAHEWQVPDLRFADINDSDPTWHEFESLTYTDQVPDANINLENHLTPHTPATPTCSQRDHKK